MRFIICKNYEEMSKNAADILASQVLTKPHSVLGLATGSTPIGMYQRFAERNLDLSTVTTFNLDEYYPIQQTNHESYYYFMKENLYSKVNIKKENIHIPNGSAEDAEAECLNYDKMIEDAGGIDLQILGVGENGHIGFNEPNTYFSAETHVETLTENTIEVNSRFFDKIEDVPNKALTMGIATIMRSKTIMLMANGMNKAAIIKTLKDGKIDPQNPVTILAAHRNVIVILDQEAASLLNS